MTGCKRRKEYLVCVDSDGCAMDTMDVKHICCFGPRMVSEWELGPWRDAVLARWNEINLYTMTRGVNRFKGLAMALREIDRTFRPIEGLKEFLRWVKQSPELSNKALEEEIHQRNDQEGNRDETILCLKKALSWSKTVNRAVAGLPEEKLIPFPGVFEALEEAHKHADVAVVSSANREAVLEEWGRHGLLSHTDAVMAQDDGTKAACIQKLLKNGYEPDRVVMCGDAPGDMEAAERSGVFFFPILVGAEGKSWKEFRETALKKLTDDEYAGEYERNRKQEFLQNLGGY